MNQLIVGFVDADVTKQPHQISLMITTNSKASTASLHGPSNQKNPF
jgi:hypothetical protein